MTKGAPRALARSRWWRARVVTVLFVVCPAAAVRSGSLTGPVLDGGRAVVVEDVAQLPFSSGSPPYARLNVLREAPDGSGRLFVNDLNGPLYAIDAGTVHTYLDFRLLFPNLKTSPGLASGFVSFAFHPEFATNGLFYTVHSEFVGTVPPNLEPALPTTIVQHSILTEWRATDPALDSFAGSSRELLRIASPHNHHNLGEISFDPAANPGDPDYGLLYVAAGDFGSVQSGQPEQLQRLDTPYGALLRIDPLGGPFERGGVVFPYGIPPANPYAGDGDPATLDELFAIGFRNGHRVVWDTIDSGAAFVTDIGEANVEEIDVLEAGRNYGWPEREGAFAIDVSTSLTQVFPLPPDDPSFGYSYPAAQYDHEDVGGSFSAVAGGVVYRKDSGTALYGALIFGDIVDGSLFHASVSDLLAADDGDPGTMAPTYRLRVLRNGQPSSLLAIVGAALGNPGVSRTDLRIAHDLSGEIYATTKQDAFVRRLIPVELAYPNGWTLAGVAVGGASIGFSVAGTALQITTTPGQTAAEVAAAMAAAVQLDATLQGQGIYGFAIGGRFMTNGVTGELAIGDSGIAELLPPALPAILGPSLGLLALGLLAARRAVAAPAKRPAGFLRLLRGAFSRCGDRGRSAAP